ncbi:TetR/AcrR family transcriptional regulator [Chromobacterium piscinae]|uniref:TetR/AcrR family transcriptional regulator n=1 Tax=Chromobacterium piscinae TaxID=686831 RepID=UPI001E623353|nr:TetR/AcrR family transcriptional regulator [Chromobacterium piscinae]MCD4506761.1 TetR/AcrR family transcriptional regulator [Chromobacterium piscinae]MCD5330529.1 TetR/AcrR family transcriptional regulator [Chromobacterium piscinae]
MGILGRLSFKDQAFKLREQAVLDATTRMLASKGFDLMTMDDVAGDAGISKPSLYKHFKSKDELATEVMIRLLDDAQDFLARQAPELSPLARLRDLLAWALRVRLEGGLPFLPSASPQVRAMLTRSLRYVSRAIKLHKTLQGIVEQAKRQGELRADMPTDVILYSYYSRTCDPAVEYLRVYGKYPDEDIVRHMLDVCFDGMSAGQRRADGDA